MAPNKVQDSGASDDEENTGTADKRSSRSFGARDGKSTRDMTGKSEKQSEMQSALTSSTETRLSEMANLDLKYTNKFVQYWLHSKVSVRLVLILTVPFISLVILLVMVISGQVGEGKVAQDVVKLSKLVDHLALVLKQLSTEHTDSLWWSLDQSLQSGITWETGGITDTGLAGEYASTDAEIEPLLNFVETAGLRVLSPRIADQMALITDDILGIYDLRYNVKKWRATEEQINTFFQTLMNQFLETIDLAATLSDSKTIQSALSLATWVRGKTGLERERHIVGQILLLKDFPVSKYTAWLEQTEAEAEWNKRFLAIAPDKWRNQVRDYLSSKDMRTFEELRIAGMAAYVPGNRTSYPTIDFDTWMSQATTVANFYRDVRVGLTNEVIGIANGSYNDFVTNLSLYIVLLVLAAVLSVGIGLLVGWSIDTPWRALVRMKDRMLGKLKEQEARDVIVNQFVPFDFLNMMGLKTIFELQLGQCMLKRATVLCSEIRNFSKLSERMAPQQNFQFLSMWLQDSGPIIRRHGGFIEKFRGTGLNAIFADPNDALDAGLELLEATQSRNQEAGNASVQIEPGLAIHTGDLMLGTVGDQQRMETAVISEALALALQICQFSGVYQANMLLSRETYMLLNVEGLTVRFLGECGVHGLHLRPHIYEVLQPNDEPKLDTLNEFNQAIKLHQEGDYGGAETIYSSVLETNPNDIVARRRMTLAQKHEWADLV